MVSGISLLAISALTKSVDVFGGPLWAAKFVTRDSLEKGAFLEIARVHVAAV